MKKMYIEPQTEAMPMTAASVLCSSAEESVDNSYVVDNNPLNGVVIE